ncbi:MAG: hypothetical protein ACIAS6_09925 [Phycisphaerales bacterium JB060]
MSTIQQTQQGTLNFVSQRIAPWTENAEQLTLSLEDTTTLSALLSDAQSKFTDAKETWNEYRAKVDAQDEAIDALYDFASLLVQQIRVAAKKDGTDNLYVLAQIEPPKKPASRTDAPIPTNLRTTSTTSGDVVLTFEGSKAGGVLFEVQRQLQPIGQQPGAWDTLATIGQKEHVDTAVPSGLAAVSYRVRTQLTTGILSQWSYPAPFYFGNGNQAAPVQAAAQSAQADAAPESGEGDGQNLTIDDAQQLKDAQTAKGKGKAG